VAQSRATGYEATAAVTAQPVRSRALSRWTATRRRLASIPGSSGLILPLVVFWALLTVSTSVFLTQANLTNLLLQASIVGLLSVGTTVVIITEEIDLSIGAVEGLAAVVAGMLIVSTGIAWPIGVVLTLGLGICCGLLNGWMTTSLRVPSFIVTLATLGIITGAGLYATNGQSIFGFPDSFRQIGIAAIGGIRLPVFLTLGLALVLHFVLTRTRLGLAFYSVGGNRKAASLVGINVGRVKIVAFCVSGGAAALAGIVQAARLDSANGSFGSNDLLDAIAAVVIGGTRLTGGVGSIFGTVLGVLLVATIRNGMNLWNVSPFLQQIVVGGIILVMGIATSRRE
jgi:ribose/xylose/arabinose/galactoside ABC-type transport system permease subunit